MKINLGGATLLAAIVALAGCATQTTSVLGKPEKVEPAIVTVSSINSLKDSSGPVTLKGTMVEKCPVAGCWFMLRDKTGVIKVDTKAAGFVVTDVPLNTEMTVTGKPILTGERRIAANSLQYK
jgi:uncharacterized protein YdeI (BOF family)